MHDRIHGCWVGTRSDCSRIEVVAALTHSYDQIKNVNIKLGNNHRVTKEPYANLLQNSVFYDGGASEIRTVLMHLLMGLVPS
jgi:radical SAM superfamily enzyme